MYAAMINKKGTEMFVTWDTPRRWAVRFYIPYVRGGYHKTIGVVALSVDRAIEAAQAQEPGGRIESVNDTGAVDLVVDLPRLPHDAIIPESDQPK